MSILESPAEDGQPRRGQAEKPLFIPVILGTPRKGRFSEPLEKELGGVITEFHTCPGCRFIVQRLLAGESG